MPFIRLANGHRCTPPSHRDDGTALIVGDEWQCDEKRSDGSGDNCGKYYRWTSEQRDGLFWRQVHT